jgi:hypothetical protein
MPCVASRRSGPAQARPDAEPRTNIDIGSEICMFSSMAPHTLHLRAQRIPDLIPDMPPCVDSEQK